MKRLVREAAPGEGQNHRDQQGVAVAPGRGRGRPRVHEEQWRRSTVVLFDSLIAWLDHLSADIRLASGTAMNRAELIRGLIGGLMDSTLDVRSVRSEAELRLLIAERLSLTPDEAEPTHELPPREGGRGKDWWGDAPL